MSVVVHRELVEDSLAVFRHLGCFGHVEHCHCWDEVGVDGPEVPEEGEDFDKVGFGGGWDVRLGVVEGLFLGGVAGLYDQEFGEAGGVVGSVRDGPGKCAGVEDPSLTDIEEVLEEGSAGAGYGR